MNEKELELNRQFIEEKVRENEEDAKMIKRALNDHPEAISLWEEDAKMIKRALNDHPEAISFWRETNDKIKDVINLTWTCMDEIIARSERARLERIENEKAFAQKMVAGLMLLDKTHEDTDVEQVREKVWKATVLFSDAFDVSKKLGWGRPVTDKNGEVI